MLYLRRVKRILFLLLLFPLAPNVRAQSDSSTNSSFHLQPKSYVYGEGLGLCEFFSVNGDLQIHASSKRMIMAHMGIQLLPQAISLYNEDFNAGFICESGVKKWCGDFGAGATFWISGQQLQKNGMLSTHSCSADTCRPSLRWGPYLSAGLRYRFDGFFVGAELTPVLFSSPTGGWNLEQRIGFCAGFWFGGSKGAFMSGGLK